MFSKNIILSIYMIDIIDIFHYLIGLIIVGFILWFLIQIHNYFSKDNVPIMVSSFTSSFVTPGSSVTPGQQSIKK